MAKEEVPAEGGEPKKKSSLIKIIILVVAVAALGGGGFFAYLKFFKKAPDHDKQPLVEQPVMQEMGTYLVNLADPGGKRYLKVTMQFELTNAKVAQELGKRSVEVRDKIIMILSSKEYEEIGNPTGKMTLKKELINQMNRFLQDGQVKEIYFSEFLVQ
ncbi:MAG TPA: flagellar basal body protein FliL [Syntrophobacteraceae bacterium]|nr:flagellar basal body protein FliL [Syntrophobacteraceae bacterium]HBZ56355.1 flagellar basal body protein FliL [Syntrophobacteraceae bacterium]